jgi:hypothetical protein
LTVLSDPLLSQIPILILFDKGNSEIEGYIELFRNKLNKLENRLINTQYIYFDKNIDFIYLGLEWLCDVMKPI